ncbi:LOW QUALITY PROTEIN: innexin inx3 [Dermatophagoides farinae]|uniref:LOW QUALITY PROTEIN: innexin inx3 n=1 Tax=Dermatophagoides farinae TaxID=6954 RepID=UPI003F62777C
MRTEMTKRLDAIIYRHLALNIYGFYFGRLIILSSIGYSIIEQYLGSIHCQGNSKIRDQFIRDVCLQGKNDFVEHRMFLSSKRLVDYSDRSYSYYPWVILLLFVQGMLAKLSGEWLHRSQHHKLKQLNRIKQYVRNAQIAPELFCYSSRNIKRQKRIQQIISFFYNFLVDSSGNQNYLIDYFTSLIFCVVTLFIQMIILDSSFDGQYLSLGIRFLLYYHFEQDKSLKILQSIDDINPLPQLFPYVIGCRFRNHGPSGSSFVADYVCTLNMNIVNAYIYLVGWFIYIFISICLLWSILKLPTELLLTIRSSHIKKRLNTEWKLLITDSNISDDYYQQFLIKTKISASTIVLIRLARIDLKNLTETLGLLKSKLAILNAKNSYI